MFCRDRVSLWSPGTHSRNPPASASRVPGLKACNHHCPARVCSLKARKGLPRVSERTEQAVPRSPLNKHFTGVLPPLSTSALKVRPGPHQHAHPCYPIPLLHRAPSLGADAPHPGHPPPGSPTSNELLPAPPHTTKYPQRPALIPRKLSSCTSGSNATAPADVRAPDARDLRVKEHAPDDRRHHVLGPGEATALVRQFMEKVTQHMTNRWMRRRQT